MFFFFLKLFHGFVRFRLTQLRGGGIFLVLGSGNGVVVWTLAFHLIKQYGPWSNPGPGVISGLISSFFESFSPSSSVFLPPQKATIKIWFDLDARTLYNEFTEALLCFVGKNKIHLPFLTSKNILSCIKKNSFWKTMRKQE